MTISEDEVSGWLASLDGGDLSKRRRAAEQRLARAQQLLSRLGGDQRRADTRRKILVGGSVLAVARRDPDFARLLRTVLDAAVTAPRDRATLGLDLLRSAGADAPALYDDRR
ncbi:MAG TPA: hypothetical protein VD978_18175 [Azospirillum sp.]|nr:hypothetical protein [Azospirillum sp.]